MNTVCHPDRFEYEGPANRQIVGQFDGGHISSDGGAILLDQVDSRIKLIEQFAGCFDDYRNPNKVEHHLEELLSQRVFGLALGYEDLNDHDDLRSDIGLAAVCGKSDPTGADRPLERDRGKPLAGKSTLNRLELTGDSASENDRYKKIVMHHDKVDKLLLDIFLQTTVDQPQQIILDLDATDDPLHGMQEGRHFHGYYRCYCYLPLYIFCGDHLLCAQLQTADIDPAKGVVSQLERIVPAIRNKWPQVDILVRGDSGFCRDDIMSWCEKKPGVDFIFGLGGNSRLNKIIQEDMVDAKIKCCQTGDSFRIFDEFVYQTLDSWDCARRVISKAECLPSKANPRFIVTSLTDDTDPQILYEQIYCGRGDMENRIKEQQLFLFADRTSTSQLRANQSRLYFSSLAYVLVNALRRFGLAGTDLAKAQCDTIRLKLLKIAALVRVTTRKIWLSFAQQYPRKQLFSQVWANIMKMPCLS